MRHCPGPLLFSLEAEHQFKKPDCDQEGWSRDTQKLCVCVAWMVVEFRAPMPGVPCLRVRLPALVSGRGWGFCIF